MAKAAPKTEPEVIYLPDYDRSAFMEELQDKYGSSEIGWTNINLYRKNQKGEWPWLYKFDAPPEIWEVSDLFGGGEYKVYINWKDQDGKTNLRTKKFIIEGPSRMPAAAQISINNGSAQLAPVSPAEASDPELKFLEKALLYKKLYGGDEKSGSSDSVIIAAMTNSHAMMMEAMKQNKPVEDPTTKRLMDKLTDVAFEKSTGSEIDTYLKIDKAINKNNPPAAAEDSVTGIIKEALPAVLEFLGNRTAPAGNVNGRTPVNPAPGVNGAATTRPINTTIQAPGGAPTELAGINRAIQEMSRIMDSNFRMVSDQVNGLQQNISSIDNRLKELEDDYWIEDAPTADNTDGMVIVNQEQEGGEKPVKVKNSIYLGMGQRLRNSSDEEKVKHLSTYVPQFGAEATYQWCRDYEAIDTLEEFNRLMKLAGFEELVLTEEYIPE